MSKFTEKIKAYLEEQQEAREISKSWNVANAAFKSKLAVYESEMLNHEFAIEVAQEKLKSAEVNGGKPIHNRDEYINQLLDAKDELTNAENRKEELLRTIEFLQETYETLK